MPSTPLCPQMTRTDLRKVHRGSPRFRGTIKLLALDNLDAFRGRVRVWPLGGRGQERCTSEDVHFFFFESVPKKRLKISKAVERYRCTINWEGISPSGGFEVTAYVLVGVIPDSHPE